MKSQFTNEIFPRPEDKALSSDPNQRQSTRG